MHCQHQQAELYGQPTYRSINLMRVFGNRQHCVIIAFGVDWQLLNCWIFCLYATSQGICNGKGAEAIAELVEQPNLERGGCFKCSTCTCRWVKAEWAWWTSLVVFCHCLYRYDHVNWDAYQCRTLNRPLRFPCRNGRRLTVVRTCA